MGFVEQAIDRFEFEQRRKIAEWGNGNQAEPWIVAAIDVTGSDLTGLRSPLGDEEFPPVAVTADWVRAGAVGKMQDEERELFLRSATGEHPETRENVEVYLLDTCPRCNELSPIGPALNGENTAEVALWGGPVVGHHCSNPEG